MGKGCTGGVFSVVGLCNGVRVQWNTINNQSLAWMAFMCWCSKIAVSWTYWRFLEFQSVHVANKHKTHVAFMSIQNMLVNCKLHCKASPQLPTVMTTKAVSVPVCKHVYFCCQVRDLNSGLCGDWFASRSCSFWHLIFGFIFQPRRLQFGLKWECKCF